MLDGCTAFGRTAFGHTAFGHTASGHASGVGALGHALAMRCDIYIYIVRYHRCTVLASPFMPVSEALGEANHHRCCSVFDMHQSCPPKQRKEEVLSRYNNYIECDLQIFVGLD